MFSKPRACAVAVIDSSVRAAGEQLAAKTVQPQQLKVGLRPRPGPLLDGAVQAAVRGVQLGGQTARSRDRAWTPAPHVSAPLIRANRRSWVGVLRTVAMQPDRLRPGPRTRRARIRSRTISAARLLVMVAASCGRALARRHSASKSAQRGRLDVDQPPRGQPPAPRRAAGRGRSRCSGCACPPG
jgi:hypothetical protein